MKKFLASVFGVMFLMSSVSFAAISPEKISLGKLTPGMSVENLISICGQPNYKHGEDWDYGTFKVEVDNDRSNVVEKIVTRSAGLSTPDGISVGQNANALNALGRADDVDVEHDGTEYEYFSTDRTKKIEFKVVNNVIVKISCKIID